MKNCFLLIFLLVFSLEAKETKIIAFYTKNVVKVSDSDVQLAIHNIMKNIANNSNVKIKEAFPKTLKETIGKFLSGKYSLITLNSYNVMQYYLQLQPHIGKIWTVAKGENHKKSKYLILTRKGLTIDKLRKLHVKYAGYRKYALFQKAYLDEFVLKTFHQGSKNFFTKIESLSSPSQIILKLFFKKIDLCVVTNAVYNLAIEMNPQLEKSLQILVTSDDIFPDIGLSFSNKGDAVVEKLYNKFIHQNEDTSGLSKLAMLYKAKKVVQLSHADLDRLYKFYTNYIKIKKKYE